MNDWHGYATSNGIDESFFRSPAARNFEQPSLCFVLSGKDHLIAAGPLFLQSRECGLWVAASHRGQGYGRQVFAGLIAAHANLCATVSNTNPHAKPMAHLLGAFAFQFCGTARGHQIWRLPPPPINAPGHAHLPPHPFRHAPPVSASETMPGLDAGRLCGLSAA